MMPHPPINPAEEEQKSQTQLTDGSPLENFEWSDVRPFNMMFKKITHKIAHPFARPDYGWNVSQLIDATIEGEIRGGKPHGLCFIFFICKKTEKGIIPKDS